MSVISRWNAKGARVINSYHARRAAAVRVATGFVSQPEPRSVGRLARGRQLVAGNLLFSGHLEVAPGLSIWSVKAPSQAYRDDIHSFQWLDDLAAAGDAPARRLAQDWVWGWIERFGRGSGPGWTPELTGRRMIRLIHHALFLLRACEPNASDQFFAALGAQARYLSRRWHKAPPGEPRMAALTGLLYSGLSLTGMEDLAPVARDALGGAGGRDVDAEGGIAQRNPEALLEVFTLLTWAQNALEESRLEPHPDHVAALKRIAPVLRALRHTDGGLARFHGSGRGLEGLLDHALANSGVKARLGPETRAMGFARLSGGRTSLVMDAAPPPAGVLSREAHASTLAFELTSGRRPLVVNCGSGAVFGSDWRRAGRATPSHSVLCLDGYSSARLDAVDPKDEDPREPLIDAPQEVPFSAEFGGDGRKIEAAHDGYVATHGLTHVRTLEMTFDGRGVAGEDLLMAMSEPDRRRFGARMDRATLAGVPFQVRFHLHPEVDATLDMGGTAVSMALRSGEIWVFRHASAAELSLEPSVYLEKSRLKPRGAQQIVLTGRAIGYATRIRWSLAKAQDTAIAIRDLAPGDADT